MISTERFADFEWLNNPNVFYVFFRLMLKANEEDKRWEGKEIKRGQLVTGRKALSEELNLTEQQIRTCLEKLTKSGYICQNSTNKYTIVTICDYDSWKPVKKTNNQQITNKQPTNNQQNIESKQAEMLKRRDEFTQALSEYKDIYERDMLNAFWKYWTEPNKSKTRMRFEMEKTWDMGRRLARWEKGN